MSFIRKFFSLSLIVSLLLSFSPSYIYADKPDYPGIWGYGGTISKAGKPWLKGNLLTLKWKDLEPSNNVFNWDKMDTAVNQAASEGLYMMPLIWTGSFAPSWLYSNGVPKYTTDFNGGSDFPFYLDPEYQTFFKRFHQKVQEHIAAYPIEKRRLIVGIQFPVGASGDPSPYKSNPDGNGGVNENGEGTPYYISPSQWDTFQRQMFQFAYNLYASSSPTIHLLFNTADSESITRWVADTMPGAWMKTNRIGDRYQNNGEALPSNSNTYMFPLIREFYKGNAIRTRSEMDEPGTNFNQAPLWNMYWTQLWGLDRGQDMHNQLSSDLNKAEFYPAFEFYSKYAGFKDPRDSTGVWVALRDGLSADDTVRFPESQFGQANRTNTQRYVNIAQAYSTYGAQQAVPADSGISRDVNHANDVGWQIYPDNYQMWLTQINPRGTSVGLWRVGSTSQMYGRFARRFDDASGKNTMSFAIDDRFFNNQPLNGAYPITIRVVYFDQGTGTWSLKYDSTTGIKTAYTVTKTNSGTWKEKIITINDGYFFNRLPNASDVQLVNTDTENDTFHMIELTRTQGDRKGDWGDGGTVPTSPPSVSPTRTPTPTTPIVPGDANGDQKVDGADYVVWLTNYGQNVSGSSRGDFNSDGKVDGVDYIVWLSNYGR